MKSSGDNIPWLWVDIFH